MTPEEAEALTAFVLEHQPGMHYQVLSGALDVTAALAELQGKPDTGNVGLTYVTTRLAKQPGWWKLTLHDACDVIGGETIDQAIIVSYKNCTVLGENS
jgi:hypothetical protein